MFKCMEGLMMIKRYRLAIYIILGVFLIFQNVLFAQPSSLYFNDVGPAVNAEVSLNTHGGGFFDFNGDGWADIFVVHNFSVIPDFYRDHALFKNLGNGTFQYWTNQAGTAGYNTSAQGLTAGDYDNDGDVDICIGMGYYYPPKTATGLTQLYRNNGNDMFTDITTSSGVGVAHNRQGRCLVSFDYDNDGWLDLLVETTPVLDLLRNNGGLSFSYVTWQANLGVTTDGEDVFGFAIGDVDNDNDLDIYFPRTIANSIFYRNNGDGTFTNATGASGLPSDNLNEGAVFFDYNNDGWLDLFLRGSQYYKKNSVCRLYKNNGNGTFANVSWTSGIAYVPAGDEYGGGLTTGDFDNDGYIDLFVVDPKSNGNRFFYNNGNGTFTNIASAVNLRNNLNYWCAPAADYNHDGYLDLYMCRNGFDTSPLFNATLYENIGGSNHWFHVKLIGGMPQSGKSNRSAIGARVFSYTEDKLQMRQVCGGTSFAMNSLEVEFGLGQYEKVDSLVIYWPSGETQKIYNIPVDTLIAVGEFNGSQYFRPFIISGEVVYYTQTEKVSDVRMVMSGDASDSSATDSFGLYDLSNVPGGVGITVTPKKTSGEDIGNNVITAWDAHLTASYFVGSDTLGSGQIYSADVDQNGKVELFDAALIARYAVGLNSAQNNRTGQWRFTPLSRQYPVMVTDYDDQDFTAFVIGDVSGNWSLNGSLSKTGDIEMPSRSIPLAAVSEELVVPIGVVEPVDLFAADIWLRYDPQKLQILDIVPAEKFGNFNLVYNESSYGLVKIAMYGTQAVSLPGELIHIVMEIADSEKKETEIQCEKFLINEVSVEMGSIFISTDVNQPSAETVLEYRLDENYPNPFNPDTEIHYALKKPGNVSLKIYDIQGRQIRTLMDVFQTEGSHVVIWDGKNDNGRDVSSGVYFCRLISGSYTHTIRMIKTK
jgi:hypothetical protein